MKKEKWKGYHFVKVMILGLMLMPASVLAGSASSSFAIPSSVISGGGGAMSSGSFQASGVTGQPTPIMDADNIPSPPQSSGFNNLPGFYYTLAAAAGCTDIAAFALTFGLTSADPAYNNGCDFDKDNDVDGLDAAAFVGVL